VGVSGHLLVVCTGNVCRSPFIQLSLAHRLHQLGSPDLVVESAGTHAMSGSRPAPAIAEALWEQDIDASNFRARQITVRQIDRAGIIVAAGREHRTFVARMRPRSLDRLFTLRQIARLVQVPPGLRGEGVDPVRELAAHCLRRRGTVGPSAGVDDDVLDPWGRDEATYRAALELMAPAVEVLASALSSPGVTR
jgi:protein-tyrosine phosphatase